MPPEFKRPYLTIPQAISELGLSRKAINAKIEAGRYTVVMDGNRAKISRASIIRDLDNEARQISTSTRND